MVFSSSVEGNSLLIVLIVYRLERMTGRQRVCPMSSTTFSVQDKLSQPNYRIASYIIIYPIPATLTHSTRAASPTSSQACHRGSDAPGYQSEISEVTDSPASDAEYQTSRFADNQRALRPQNPLNLLAIPTWFGIFCIHIQVRGGSFS